MIQFPRSAAARGALAALAALARPLRHLALAALAVFAASAAAMRVSPMVIEMQTEGSASTARIEVQNINPGRLAFETRVTRADFQPDGTIIEVPADEDFLIFPPQGVLANSQRQVIRLQWLGGPLEASRAYYVAVRQLPVALEPTAEGQASAQVQVLYRMKALVTVEPRGAKSKVEIVGARPIDYIPPANPVDGTIGPAQPGVEVTMRNTGNRHAMTAAAGWIVEGTNTNGKPVRIALSPSELNTLIGTGYVAAVTGERTFRFPVAEALTGQVTVRFQ
jgi:fimbrial chaperone protein